MANESNQITQIYELRSLGFKQITTEFDTINKQLQDIAKNKQNVGKGGSIVDPADLAKLRAQLDAVKESTEEVGTATANLLAYFADINKQYQDAAKNAQAYSVELGVNSDKYKEATTQAGLYRQELLQINDLLKGGAGGPTAPVGKPSAPTAPAQTQQTAEQIKAVREALVEEGDAVAAAAQEFGNLNAEALKATIPLQEQTGTLSKNIALFNLNKNAIGQVKDEMASLAKNTSAADKEGVAYQSRISQLTAEERRLTLANRELNQTINAQLKYTQAAEGSVDQLSAKLGIMRNYYRGLSDEAKASPFGKQLVDDIQVLDTQVKKADATVGNFQRNVGNYAGKAFGYLRTLANILPGIGLAGLFGLAFEGIQSLFQALLNTTPKINTFAENLKNLNEVSQSSNKSIAEQSSQLKILFDATQNANLPLEERKRAVEALQKLFPDYFGSLTQEQILNGQVGNSYKLLTQDIIDNARAIAAKSKIDDIEAKRLDAEYQKQKIRSANSAENRRSQLSGGTAQGSIAFGGGAGSVTTGAISTEDEIKINNARAQAAIKVIDKQIDSYSQQEKFLTNFAGVTNLVESVTDKVLGKQKAGIEALKKQLVEIINQISLTAKNDPGYALLLKRRDDLKKQIKDIEGTATSSNGKADRLGAANTNAQNLIDAQLKAELAAENTRVNLLRKDHELTYDEERQYLENVLAINEKYFAQKIAAIRGNNTKEVQERATIREQLTALELNTQKAIEAVNKKQFEDRLNELKAQNDRERALIQQNYQDVLNDPSSTASVRAEAKLEEDRQLLALQTSFNLQVSAQELLLKQHSEKNERERSAAILQIETQLRQDRLAIARATVQDIQTEGDRQVLQASIALNKMRLAILENDKIGNQQKQDQLAALDRGGNITLLSLELDALNKETATKKQLYKQNLISNDEYLAAVKKQQEKALQLTNATNTKADQTKTQKFLSKQLSVVGADGQQHDIGISTGQLIASGYDLAASAMNEYYNAEADRIAASRDDNINRLELQKDKELEVAKARGASQAQQEAISKKFAAQEDAIRKESGEKLKKQKRAEVAISLATELANIAAAAAANPANAVTFGAAGVLQATILGGIAIVKSGLQLAAINRQKFAFGGIANNDFPIRGGRIKGKSHSQGGTPFYGEAQRGEIHTIIRTEDADQHRKYTFTGTQAQVASALNVLGGGVSFANGARVQKYAYGGVPGAGLSAPLYIPARTAVSGNNQDVVNEMRAQNAYLAANFARIEQWANSFEVNQVTSTVTNAQRKEVSQRQIATIGKRN